VTDRGPVPRYPLTPESLGRAIANARLARWLEAQVSPFAKRDHLYATLLHPPRQRPPVQRRDSAVMGARVSDESQTTSRVVKILV
jgi:hypothetical protein